MTNYTALRKSWAEERATTLAAKEDAICKIEEKFGIAATNKKISLSFNPNYSINNIEFFIVQYGDKTWEGACHILNISTQFRYDDPCDAFEVILRLIKDNLEITISKIDSGLNKP